ncbi:MAG: cytochrome P450 [Halobacteriota archaeon]
MPQEATGDDRFGDPEGGSSSSLRTDSETDPADPPGPDGYPLVGNTFQILSRPFEFLSDLTQYGDVVRYRIAGNTMTALLHPDHVQRVLVGEPDRFERYLFSDRGFNFAPEGLLFAEREQWRTQRQIVQPAFTIDRIRSYTETMRSYAEDTAAGWDDGEVVALNREFSALTLRILSKALFDVEADPDADDEIIVRAARTINEQSSSRTVASFLPTWVPTPSNRRYRRVLSAYRDRIDSLITARRSNGTDGDDLLSILLEAEGPDGTTLSESEIRDTLITFGFAGHETTSLALTYAVLLIATHEHVRENLDAEYERVLGRSQLDFAAVRRLEYTDRVITEAMRLYPPAYMIFRKATEATVIGGYRIPAGSILTLPQYQIHRDDRFYDDPAAFRPDRWTDEFEAQLPEYAYFPFGGGPRHCIGMRFATLELKVILSTLLRRFEFELVSDPDPELSPGATLHPTADVSVRLHERR